MIVETVNESGALAPGLDVDRATDILWTLNHPDCGSCSSAQRGWTPEQFEQWFADTACAQLLGRPVAEAADAGDDFPLDRRSTRY